MSDDFPFGRGRSIAAGLAAGAAIYALRALTKPLPSTDRRLLDWDEVRRVAAERTGERGDAYSDAAAGARYDAMAAELLPAMEEVVGTIPGGLPRFTVLDRRGFIDRNLVIVRRLFAGVEELRARLPETRATALGRTVTSRYVGELLGFLSSRVLGQYDPVLMLAPPAVGEEADVSALYLVEPNVIAFQQRAGIDDDTLRRWLIMHEVTHAWQFEAHPWLREYLGRLLNDMLMTGLVAQLGAAADQAERTRTSPVAVLRRFPGDLRAQLRGVGRVQTVMSVCEGYSNFVMHRAGREHLADFDRLEAAFHRRASERPPLERVVFAVTGLAMKMRQYEAGERFADAVVERGGLGLLNRVWEGPEMLPTSTELRSPELWVTRVRASG